MSLGEKRKLGNMQKEKKREVRRTGGGILEGMNPTVSPKKEPSGERHFI